MMAYIHFTTYTHQKVLRKQKNLSPAMSLSIPLTDSLCVAHQDMLKLKTGVLGSTFSQIKGTCYLGYDYSTISRTLANLWCAALPSPVSALGPIGDPLFYSPASRACARGVKTSLHGKLGGAWERSYVHGRGCWVYGHLLHIPSIR